MSGMNEPIKVLKLNLAGEVTWQYEGRILAARNKFGCAGGFLQSAGYSIYGCDIKGKGPFC